MVNKEETYYEVLFEENDGWIATRNLKYTTKLTTVQNIYATDDELEKGNWFTIKNEPIPKNKPKNFVPYPIYSKTLQLLLRDILCSEGHDNYFVFKGISFLRIFLCGTITLIYKHKGKDCLVVDDGTGSIVCFVDNNYIASANEKRAKVEKELKSLLNNSSEYRKDLLVANQAVRYELKQIPRVIDEHLLGKAVQLHGKVKEHCGKKYIFLDNFQLIREDDDKLIRHLEETLHKYNNEYFKGSVKI